ncbi:MAG: sialidase family protein [Planctomycetota bacterium]|nr:sialidase family protein [Planctomycetota bacterium]
MAAFYGYDGAPKFFRISTDGGLNWGPEHPSPPEMDGGQASGTLTKGGTIRPVGLSQPIAGEQGWYQQNLVHFNNDFTAHTIKPTRVYMPGAINQRAKGRSYVWSWPAFHSRIETLANGDLIAALYGLFDGDAVGSDRGCRVIVVRSNDHGQTWRYQGTVSHAHQDPHPQLPGMFAGFTESSIAQLQGGKLLCMLRSQGSHLPSEYRPLYVSWSDDLGKTWTTPTPTRPHLMNILPTLVTLDNGVIAAVYGRPGVHVAFSTDDGHTWFNRISFSHLKVGLVTGQVDGRQVAPDRLVVIGGIDSGTWVFPITVERQVISPARQVVSGRVVDDRGKPIVGARVQLSPNRYAAHSWNIIPADPGLPGYYHEPFFTNKMMPDSPRLAYRSIRQSNQYPVVSTDPAGRFRIKDIKLGEWILTVEAEDFAPQLRRIQHLAKTPPHTFQLQPGRGVQGRVVDRQGQPVVAACVVLGHFHCHTDVDGHFSWSLPQPVPAQVAVKVHKRYSRQYTVLQKTMSLADIEQQPIVLDVK